MLTLQAKTRTIVGKNVHSLRKAGVLPAVVYGAKGKAHSLALEARDFLKVWKSAGESTLLDLQIEGEAGKSVLIHEVNFDPKKDQLLHVDFYEVQADHVIKVHVPIEFMGEADAIKVLGGVLLKVLHEIEVEALPKDLPHEIIVDITQLRTFDDVITIGDISSLKNVKIMGDPGTTIVKVVPPRSDEEIADLGTQEPVSLDTIEVVERGKKEEPAEGEVSASE